MSNSLAHKKTCEGELTFARKNREEAQPTTVLVRGLALLEGMLLAPNNLIITAEVLYWNAPNMHES